LNAQEIANMLRARPFKPLLFRFNDGQTELVTHPEMVIVGFDFLQFGIPHATSPVIAESTKLYNMQNLVSVERSEAESASA
jgi:hypothetical protein